MTEPQQPQVNDVDGDEDEDDAPLLEDIGRDYERLHKRIATLVKNHSNGEEVSVADALRMQGELVMLVMDHLAHTKRMESHAFWASEQIDGLLESVGGDSETSSQLHASDAEKYTAFVDEVIADLDRRIRIATGESPGEPDDADDLRARRLRAVELKALTEDITLEPADDDGDDSTTDDASAEASDDERASEGTT